MSMKADIDGDFEEMTNRYPEMKTALQELRFNVYASLEWEDAAEGVVEYCKENDIPVTTGMQSYLDT